MKRLVLALSFTCISAQAWSAPVEVIESADLQKRVARLERMLENPVLLQLSDRLEDQEKEIQQLGDQIDRLNWRIKQLQKRHQQDIAALQAQIEDLNNKFNKMATAIESIISVTSEVTATLPATQLLGSAGPVTAAASETKPASKGAAAASEKKPLKPADSTVMRAYDAAMTLLRKARYEQAAEAFKDFLKKYSDTQLAPNAAYWAGEAYMAQLNYQQAWPYFEQVIKKYPDSNKYDDSLYRGADALYQQGKKKEAMVLLKRLIQDNRSEKRLKQRAEKLLESWAKAP